MPYLELFEPRSVYISELKLQHAWKNMLWKLSRFDTEGQSLKVLSPGRHNYSDGPDFIGASLVLEGRLIHGDIEIHHRSQDWYNHEHHEDPAYDNCALHVVFHDPAGTVDVRCHNGSTPATCYIPLEEALEFQPENTCRIFRPEKEKYYEVLKKEGLERVRNKIRYFYDNRLRFPDDVMLYWGLFKACGYRYNEENMIRLFVRFPWAAYCDELLDRKDILPMLNELAGFNDENKANNIRWTRSRTRPAHFPENRVNWLGKMMTHYYRASLSGMIYDMFSDNKDIFSIIKKLFALPESTPPGEAIKTEMIMNTVLPLLEAIRMDRHDNKTIEKNINKIILKTSVRNTYGTVQRFHDLHGIEGKDKDRKNWLISQGVLNISDKYCSQSEQLNCPICLLNEDNVIGAA